MTIGRDGHVFLPMNDSCRWFLVLLAELLVEHQKLGPLMQVLPICNKLLSQGAKELAQ
ncbi:hypothetical protein BDA96_07G100700 [Sorghum bicolor]|uniref:Uncharacterized protein n=2 Tax=Sorghum bicolor TaxID=4558 RepID=A0A921U9C8_SORBI|nr:hypothetical protein BDA96_07G100700 [Sorghum bicolor]KXG24854.1 hypothetical protein SORBI_3007G094500 [Sorghum bicolor]